MIRHQDWRPSSVALQKRLQETGPEFQPMFGAELTRFIENEQKFWLPLAKKYAT